MSRLHPTSSNERFQLLDVLRGFALLGVLLANMVTHSGYFLLSEKDQLAFSTAALDHSVEWIEHFLIDGKFYSLFSMLFGIGFALQLQRSSALETKFLPRFLRRLFIMFILGLLHAIFFYVGDILTVYAITGLILILFRKATDRVLLTSAVVLMALPVLQYAVMWALHVSAATPVVEETGPRFFDQVLTVYRSGSYPEILQMNLGGLIMGRYPDLFFTGRFFRVLAMFLIGFYVARKMLFANVQVNRAMIRKVLTWGAIIGFPCNILLAVMMTGNAYYNFETTGIIEPLAYAFGVPALCLFYAAAISLLFENAAWKQRLKIFAPVGQMALTNYLMQSVICALIFMSYGLGWTASVGPAKLSLLALMIYILQIIFSHIWMRNFRFGPMEWLWRSLTYGKRQSFKKESGDVPAITN